nr:gtp-binding protein 2 [Quercus suber]
MASIFTWESDTPRVASPWLQGIGQDDERAIPTPTSTDVFGLPEDLGPLPSSGEPDVERRVTRLQAEPQEGPVEYKLHLLLRPRRRFRSTSTGSSISGSRHSKFGISAPSSRATPDSAADAAPAPGSSSATQGLTQQTRQHRLQQLTTQLLWRLQQSSPHHTSSATNIILPSLPEALPELQAPQQPAKLLHGLEESQGALYEIGVSDDGTLVGLADDELQESLNNLRAMAACLGCTVEVLRKETVGECEWIEEVSSGWKSRQIRRSGNLVVAEALIKPCLNTNSPPSTAKDNLDLRDGSVAALPRSQIASTATEQLRVTLTGPTMSGKSTLLGTLTTSTLDNGRGKSRLSMLKHRHEITSGITSSVTQELLGYQDTPDGNVKVVNYAIDNVASWIDVHAAGSGSRLVFLSDSAGHPRYRRTTIRGLVGWAPHWTLLCVPADDTEDTGGKDGSTIETQQLVGNTVSELDLSGAQLSLCLRLNLPLIIVITKLDLASRTGLRQTLSKVLDALKAAAKKPAILPNATGTVHEQDLQNVSGVLLESTCNTCVDLLNDAHGTVPIVLTSSLNGTGINNLHALLHELPIPDLDSGLGKGSDVIYHIEDVYSKLAEVPGVIVSGRLRSGQISVGDMLMLGPFSSHDQLEDSEDSDERPSRRRNSAHLPASRSFPGALPHLAPRYFALPGQEWRRAEVTSVRNLRLPVHTLMPDQVGTIALIPKASPLETSPSPSPLSRIRKGMVLVSVQPIATRTFVAEFAREDLESLAVGNHVVVYTASVRASAKIISARAPDSPAEVAADTTADHSTAHDPFHLEDFAETIDDGIEGPPDRVAGVVTAARLLVTFNFDVSKEFVVLGEQVLVMPGGGPGLYGGQERGEKGLAGLEGFVGKIMEVFG